MLEKLFSKNHSGGDVDKIIPHLYIGDDFNPDIIGVNKYSIDDVMHQVPVMPWTLPNIIGWMAKPYLRIKNLEKSVQSYMSEIFLSLHTFCKRVHNTGDVVEALVSVKNMGYFRPEIAGSSVLLMHCALQMTDIRHPIQYFRRPNINNLCTFYKIYEAGKAPLDWTQDWFIDSDQTTQTWDTWKPYPDSWVFWILDAQRYSDMTVVPNYKQFVCLMDYYKELEYSLNTLIRYRLSIYPLPSYMYSNSLVQLLQSNAYASIEYEDTQIMIYTLTLVHTITLIGIIQKYHAEEHFSDELVKYSELLNSVERLLTKRTEQLKLGVQKPLSPIEILIQQED